MNHIYKSIFNKALGVFVAVPEFASSHTKSSTSSSETVGTVAGSTLKTTISALALMIWAALLPTQANAQPGIYINDGQDTGCSVVVDHDINGGFYALSVADGSTRYVRDVHQRAGTRPQNELSYYGVTASGDYKPCLSATGAGATLGQNARDTQTNRTLFYGDNHTVNQTNNGAKNLTLGGRLDVNSGIIGVGDRGVNGSNGTNSIRMGTGTSLDADNNKINAITIGINSGASAGQAIAIGSDTKASGTKAIAIGVGANASYSNILEKDYPDKNAFDQALLKASGAIAIGEGATSSHDQAISFGYKTKASNDRSLAFGSSAQAAGQSSISIGSSAATTDVGGLAVGNQASSKGDSSTALGAKTKADEAGAVAVGNASEATKHSAVAIGNSSNAGIQSSIAIGRAAKTTGTGEGAIAIGRNANADGQGSTSMGINARSSGQSIAIGTNANNTKGTAQPIGASTVTIGNNANAQSARSIAFGNDAVAGLASAGGQVTAALAIGSASKAEGQGSVVIGDSATNTRATDNKSYPAADQVVSIGVSSSVNSLGGVAVGSTAKTTGVYGAAIGIGTVNETDFGVALGALSTTDKTITVNRLGYLGDQYNDIAVTKANAAGVSIGGTILNTQGSSPGQTAVRPSGVSDGQVIRRQLHNLAAGTADTDAVNVAQLKAVSAKTDRTPLTTTTDGKVNVPTGDKLATAADIANAINAAGFKLTVAATTEGTLDGVAGNELINAGDTVTVEADKNIKVKQANGKVTISTEDNVEFTSVKTGDSTLNGDGLTITGGPSVTKTNGIDAGGKQIKNVANGTAGTDAVNVSQLNAVKTTAESKLGDFTVGADAAGNATGITVNNGNNRFDVVGVDKVKTAVDGNKINVDLTDAAKTSLGKADSALQSIKVQANGTDVKELTKADNVLNIAQGNNIEVSKDGNNVKVALKDNIAVTSVTAGNSKLDTNGLTITGGPSVTNAGIKAGNQVIADVAKGKADTDAVNVSQLKPLATALGSTVAADGTVNAPSLVVTKADGTQYTGAPTVQGALDNIGTEIKKPINFAGNTGNFDRTLGTTTTIKGSLATTTTASSGNIRTEANNGTIEIKFADAPTFAGKVTAQGGLDVNNNKITGVANGKADSDAVNYSQLKAVEDAVKVAQSGAWELQSNGAKVSEVGAGSKVDFVNGTGTTASVTKDGNNTSKVTFNVATTTLTSAADGKVAAGDAGNKFATAQTVADAINAAGFTLASANGGTANATTAQIKAGNKVTIDAGKNLTATQTGSVVTLATKDSVEFTSVKAGDSTLTSNGLTINGGPSVTKTNGINAGNKQIKGVTNGTANTDAVNVSQLNPLATALGSTVAADGTVNAPSLVVTKADGTKYAGTSTVQGALDNIGTEIKKPINFAGNTGNFDRTLGTTTTIKGSLATTTAASSGNIRTEANNGTIEIKFADAPTFAGKVTARGGLDVNNQKITGVANGTANTDAVNYSQLKAVEDAVKVAQSGAWELQSNGANVSQIGAGSKVDFVNGTGTTASVTKDGNNTSKVTFNVATTTLTSAADGKVAAGDAGNKFATAQTVADAINAAGFTLASANGGTANATTAQIKAGNKVTIDAGKNLTATQTGSVVTLATKDSVEFTSVKAGDSTLTSNGLTINGGPSVTKTGINSGGKKITDVADGTVTANSKDAVNGGQLHNVKTIADAKLGAFTVGAGAAAGITVNNGNNRFDVVGVDKITTSVAGNKINVDLTQAAKADLQKGVDAKTATDKGINFGNGTTSANYALGDTLNVKGDKNISSTTLPGKGGIQLGLADTIAVGTKAPVTINGTAGTVTGLTNKAWNPNSITSGRAATEDQLKALNDTVGGINSYSGWKLTTSNSTNPTLEDIGQGETVTVDSGENIAITQAGNKITVATKKDVTFTNVNATTVKAGGSTLNNNGLTISGGPSVTKGGIDAANTKIGNVNNGTVSSTSKDAVNGSQLFAQGEGVKNIIGGTTVYNSATGTYTNPNIGGTGKGNINDAIQSVNDTANKGWTLTAQGANGGKVAPGETVDLRNTDGNIKVSKTAATDTVSFDLAKDLKVDSVKAGNTTVNNDGVSVAGGPSLKADGIDAANKKITNVADGTIAAGSKEAVNGGQLHTLETKINDVSKNAKTTTVKAGHNVTVSSKVTGNNTEYTVNAEKTTVSGSGDVVVTAGAPDATGVTNYTADLSADAKAKLAKADNSVQNVVSADPNLTASKDAATGVVTLDFSDTPTFSAVTAGKTTVGNVVTDGATNKISGLEKGEVSATSKEAVNGSQLFAQGEGVKDIIGGTTVYNPATGTYTNPNIGGTGKGNINDAIQSIHSVANAGWNLTAQGANSSNVAPNATVDLRNNDGNIVVGKSAANNTVNFDLSKDLNVDSVKANTFKAGNTTVNNDGVMIINPLNPANNVSLTSNGLNNGGHVISNIAAGKADNDAVNVSQLKGTATALGGGAGINPDGSFKAPTYTTVKTDGTTVSANNVGDALTHLNNEVVKPLTFAADNGANVERKLGSTLNINGDNRNIRTVTTPEGVKVELNDVLNVNGVNASWVSVNNGPSMTHKGIEMNNLPITGMASGLPTYTTPSGEVKTMTTSQIAQAIQDKLLDESVLKNAVNVGDLTEQAQNVLNVSKIIYGEDGDGNPYVRADGTMSSAGRAALRTYNVDDSGTVENNGIFTAIRNMNEQGIKFFHTNDGVTKGDKQSHSEEDSNANAAYSTAIGYQALVEKDAAGGLAIGAGAKVSRPQSIALGAGSEAIEGHIAQGTPENAYTYGAQNDGQVAAKPTAKTAVLSVGKAGQERQVQHVAAGVVSATSTDAVNGSQLYYTNKAVESNTRAINQVRGDLHKADRQLRAGVAGAVATAGLPQAYIPGKSMVAAAAGSYRGEAALAVGVSRISDNGKVILKLTGNTNTRGDVGASIGAGYQW